jgi:hypothetical protein
VISSIRARPAGLRRARRAAALIALPLAGCVAGDATVTRSDGLAAAARARRAAVAAVPIDRLTAVAKRRYADEVWGRQAHATLRRVGRDRALLGALRSGDLARLRSYVDSQFHRVWYHWHVSRLRIVRGSRILTDVGVPFVVAPSQRTLRDARGRSLATLQVSIQDVVGFVRYMHRNYGVDVLVRGRRASHVRTSLPAARDARLPDSGTATVAGTRYQVRSFTRTALGHEAVRVWILRGG